MIIGAGLATYDIDDLLVSGAGTMKSYANNFAQGTRPMLINVIKNPQMLKAIEDQIWNRANNKSVFGPVVSWFLKI